GADREPARGRPLVVLLPGPAIPDPGARDRPGARSREPGAVHAPRARAVPGARSAVPACVYPAMPALPRASPCEPPNDLRGPSSSLAEFVDVADAGRRKMRAPPALPARRRGDGIGDVTRLDALGDQIVRDGHVNSGA